MLSKFERGEADLSSMKLITALDNIHSDLNEFMYLVRGFPPRKRFWLFKKIFGIYMIEKGVGFSPFLGEEETTQKYRSSGETSYLLQMIRIKAFLCF